jgi:hypothetical protein
MPIRPLHIPASCAAMVVQLVSKLFGVFQQDCVSSVQIVGCLPTILCMAIICLVSIGLGGSQVGYQEEQFLNISGW